MLQQLADLQAESALFCLKPSQWSMVVAANKEAVI